MDSWDNPAFDAMQAYHRTAALTAAVRLDVVTLVGGGAATAEALAEKTAASIRGMRILCDFLTVMGLLSKQDGAYSATEPAKRYLDRSSPAWIGSAIDFFAAPEMLSLVLGDPVSYVRRGGSSGLAYLAPDHPIWVHYAKAVTPIARVTAKRAAAHLANRPSPPTKVLDVAVGHGFYGIELATVFPEAVVTAVDWPSVLELATVNAREAGVSDRYRTVAGSAFEVDWGNDFDLVVLANILHFLSPEECAALLRKVKSSLSSRGLACAVEFVPNEDRVSPPTQAMFAYLMLATSPGGDAHTLSDYDNIARAAGFRGATSRLLRPTPQSLIMFET
jgi:2-polyprenyl-3-methyl-5-hydroxy-6-metoxy-1,4-benzoquinol methylase